MSHDDFLKVYTRDQSVWEDFVRRLVNLIEDLVKSESIDFHVVEGRSKTVESVREKLSRPGKSYENPSVDLPDLAGVRVVVYDKESLDKAAEVIDREFRVDASSSADKSKELSPDQFGYLSFHKVVSLPYERVAMTEWSRFSDMHAEIQIRTVLQHAWASISHKMQYKRESEIPAVLRRRLTRLAGLFELADDEFLALRAADREMRDSIAEEVDRKEFEISLDIVSISTWFPRSKFWHLIEEALGDSECVVMSIDDENYEQLFSVAQKVGFKTIYELESALEKAMRNGKQFFEKIDCPMMGDRQHFSAVLLIAANLRFFKDMEDYPFTSVEYIESIRDAGREVFGDAGV